MIYILIAILVLLVAVIIMNVYILKADKIIENVLDSERNIRMHLNDIDKNLDEIHKMTYDHGSEIESIGAFMKISTDTLVDICEKLKTNSSEEKE